MKPELSLAQKNAVGRIGGLVLVNAMIFQEILAGSNHRVLTLERVLSKGRNAIKEFTTHWDFIINEINYYPIFHVASEILKDLSMSKSTVDAVEGLVESAQEVVSTRAALRHDLMGRVYHRLLAERKYLGTYYTSIPAARLLLKLSLQPQASKVNWHDIEDVRQLRIADLACGTGTLLMAAADAVTDNYVGECARRGLRVDPATLQNRLAEEVILGYDVLPSAIHLTASTLALRAPEITFKDMKLWSLPLGGPGRRLGSIEFMAGGNIRIPLDLFRVKKVEGRAVGESDAAELPMLDLCVMNPPFTRSVGGNLLFGSVPEQERTKMQSDLKKMVRRYNLSASITAGLGAVFVAIADPFIKYGGRIALVLPKAVLSGVAWQPTRDLLRRKYRLEYVIASQDPERWNFSESTSLSEVLIIAKKVRNNSNKGLEEDQNGTVTAINLWRNPTIAFDALAVTFAVQRNSAPDLENAQGALDISLSKTKLGEAVSLSWAELKGRSSWLLPCAFAQSDLSRVAVNLMRGRLWLPGYGIVGELTLRTLQELGQLGPDRRGIHDGFKLSQAKTAFPALWGHEAKAVYTMAQLPNRYLSPLARPKKTQKKPVRKVEQLWPFAGRLLVAERIRLNTQGVMAVLLPRPVLSNVWWPFSPNREVPRVGQMKALVLWLNSTLGLLCLLSHREDTEGAWVAFKKTVLSGMPVLDLLHLSSEQVRTLAETYDRLAQETLLPLPSMYTDPVRRRIDDSIQKALNLPDFSILRELLAQEPIICLQRL